MWQKCPICNGEGNVSNNGLSSSTHKVCPLCKGSMIISELNGLPPTLQSNEVGTPQSIHLPTDEDIMQDYEELFYDGIDINYEDGFMDGAKWIRETISDQINVTQQTKKKHGEIFRERKK